MIRVCPHSDAACLHGMGCTFSCATGDYNGTKVPLAKTLSVAATGVTRKELDAAILSLNRLTGCGEDFIWRPADKVRSLLIRIRDEGSLSERDSLSARVAELEGAIRGAAAQFYFYADSHRAKHTPDADAKAEVNLHWAARLRALLPPTVQGAQDGK